MKTRAKPVVICLMGPTASGKTPLAIELVQQLPCEIVSVDSAQIYKYMDIGTAKPTKAELNIAPHRLIDILNPTETYSAGQFVKDATHAIDTIFKAGKIPLLVGGTMLYFRVLQQGIAPLPAANLAIRRTLQQQIMAEGIEKLYEQLQNCDPFSAAKIKPKDTQRITRALEVYMLTGKSMSYWQNNATHANQDYQFFNIGLYPNDRLALHDIISERFLKMLDAGFVNEVRTLQQKNISNDLPSMRSVGYRQVFAYLKNEISYATMCEQGVIATRQLAKRQMTWLRSFRLDLCLDAYSAGLVEKILSSVPCYHPAKLKAWIPRTSRGKT